jgi:hypothetical protein
MRTLRKLKSKVPGGRSQNRSPTSASANSSLKGQASTGAGQSIAQQRDTPTVNEAAADEDDPVRDNMPVPISCEATAARSQGSSEVDDGVRPPGSPDGRRFPGDINA